MKINKVLLFLNDKNFYLLKKVISILLALLIFTNSIGYIFFYIERLANNKREIREYLNTIKDSSILLQLKFTRQDFIKRLNWKEEDEFEFEGKMYDVERIEININDVIIFCIRDHMEESLISNYERIHNDNKLKDKIHSSLQVSLFNYHLIAVSQEINFPERIFYSGFFFNNYFNYYKSKFKEFPTPPPKFA